MRCYQDELMRQVIEEVGVLHDQISEKFRYGVTCAAIATCMQTTSNRDLW
jgi:hypothetical protein